MAVPRLRPDYYTTCMHGLDDVGWRAGFLVTGFGVRIGVRSSDDKVLRALESRVPFASALKHPDADEIADRIFSILPLGETAPGKSRFNLYSDHELHGRNLDCEGLLDSFELFSSLAIAELSSQYLFVHAGVVEWEGRGILLPGVSRSGKSTLVNALVEQGARYYSDEYALVDAHGMVSPYPRPISLREGGTRKRSKRAAFCRLEATHHKPLRINLVAFCTYRRRSRWRPVTLSPGEGLMGLMQHTLSARRNPARALDWLHNLVTHAAIVSGGRGEASRFAPRIIDETLSRRRFP